MDAHTTNLITRMCDDIDEQIDDPRAENSRHFLCDIFIVAFFGVMSRMRRPQDHVKKLQRPRPVGGHHEGTLKIAVRYRSKF